MNYPQFWIEASPRRKRIYSALFVFALTLVAMAAGFAVPVSPEFAQEIYNQLNQTVTEGNATGTLAASIFTNNFLLCLAMFIPLAGIGIGLFIMFSTGLAFRAVLEAQLAMGVSTTPPVAFDFSTAILALALVGITFVAEFVSYTIGMTESVWLFRRLTQRRWRELKITAKLIGVVALLLTVGAIVETYALMLT
ncbi:MAG TPA: stage II sporulation protein M [Candidatus Deferrimicrobiaceae bacterium]|nr:stage II sporulation protein M [Candidatus Deferrimicrobiaceae bacterium]